MMNIIWFSNCSYKNKHLVGGKNSSLGELYNLSQIMGFHTANGFAITTTLYDEYIKQNKLDVVIENLFNDNSIDISDLDVLNRESKRIKELITNGSFNDEQEINIHKCYTQLCNIYNTNDIEVAVRSSAIAEDLPNASFAGQQDTFLNVRSIDHLLIAIKKCFASLYNSCAISYRSTHNIDISQVKISVGVQKMVRSDIGSAGVSFSIDPETGYNKAIIINSSFGLGESVVSGSIKPDEIIIDKRTLNFIDSDPIIMKKLGDKHIKTVYKDFGDFTENTYENKSCSKTEDVETSTYEKLNFSITNNQAIILGKIVYNLEKKYMDIFDKKCGVDIEWAIDGIDRNIYIIQSRPETVHSNVNNLELQKYILDEKSAIISTGVSVGNKISCGPVKILQSVSEYKSFQKGDILVTDMTTPDWEPLMKISSGIITNKGGRTCHAAIVARELGINAVVGTGNITNILSDVVINEMDNEIPNKIVTICCSEGEKGIIYDGNLKYHIDTMNIDGNKQMPIKMMFNVGNPENSFSAAMIPNEGVGLARLEFIINNYIKIHPLALCEYPNVEPSLKNTIYDLIGDHENGRWFFIKRLARGISKIASAFYPNDVVVRLSDFKSNEYKSLIGGNIYEPSEENPMIGWRGASRYYSKDYTKAFELECLAIQYAINVMKMTNIIVMIPFCRTTDECKLVIETMEKYGLKRGENGLKIYLMCEIPSNVIEADLFSQYVDGVSIGGNDLLQLTLGIDRDSEKITYLSQHTNISYRRMISSAIKEYKKNGVKVGFCGQQPSDSLEFTKFLIDEGIDSISVIPESAINTIHQLGKV
jgi:pyruvate, water dikinase